MKGAAFLQPDLGYSVIVMALDPRGKRAEGMNVFPCTSWVLVFHIMFTVTHNVGLETTVPI